MPNVLVLSFEGFSFTARQLYEQLLPKLLSRAAVHESQTIQDALSYIQSGWPSVILVTDAIIASEDDDSEHLLAAVADYTKHGHTTILMGFFASAIEPATANTIFRDYFGLKWEIESETPSTHPVKLAIPDEGLLRTHILPKSFVPEAYWLRKVSGAQMIYLSSSGGLLFYSALAKVGLGKLGYIGDTGFGNEPERLVLAMCHLDRPEDSLEDIENMES
jgi:hypothetical protein